MAFAEAQQTLNEVKAAMKINYFDDAELIKVQSRKVQPCRLKVQIKDYKDIKY